MLCHLISHTLILLSSLPPFSFPFPYQPTSSHQLAEVTCQARTHSLPYEHLLYLFVHKIVFSCCRSTCKALLATKTEGHTKSSPAVLDCIPLNHKPLILQHMLSHPSPASMFDIHVSKKLRESRDHSIAHLYNFVQLLFCLYLVCHVTIRALVSPIVVGPGSLGRMK